MSRDSQGLYTLPPGNPVVAGTLIESVRANTTMNDIAQALTNSLPRDGSAPMLGPLTLPSGDPTQSRHATNKAYVDKFMAYATGLPLGAVFAYAGGDVLPSGYLVCDGAAVSRTTYSFLFGAIGTIYGAGDNVSTFNLPDLRDWFIRGKSDSRPQGSQEQDTLRIHTHPVSDPGHLHIATTGPHTHTDPGHSHALNDPGHAHNIFPDGANRQVDLNNAAGPGNNQLGGFAGGQNLLATKVTGSAQTGLGMGTASITITSTTVDATVATALTGLSVGNTGDAETRPKNVAMVYYIKAINDTLGPAGYITNITTSDANAISVDNTIVTAPNLVIHSNVAFGLAQLDSSGKVPSSLLPVGAQSFLGPYDASTGNNPSQQFPLQTFASGDTFLVIVGGTILVYDPLTYVSAMTLVTVGENLVYLNNGANPVGWYNIAEASTAVTAAAVSISPPIAGLTANNVQSGLAELVALNTTTAANANTFATSIAVAMAIALG